jgi:hypothetical protein
MFTWMARLGGDVGAIDSPADPDGAGVPASPDDPGVTEASADEDAPGPALDDGLAAGPQATATSMTAARSARRPGHDVIVLSPGPSPRAITRSV